MQLHLALLCLAVLGGALPATARPEPRRRQPMDPRRCELPRSVSWAREGERGEAHAVEEVWVAGIPSK